MDKLDLMFSEINEMIESVIGETGREYTIGKFTGIGWLDFHYVCSTYDGMYPRISLKKQSSGVHLYVMSPDYGLLAEYEDVFGKSGLGKGCIRVKTLTADRMAGLRDIVEKVKAMHEGE